jgi:hypothetical protein
VLSEFRTRLVALSAEERFLEAVLTLCKEQGWLKARGQRLDSSGAVRFNEVTGPLLAQLQIMVPMEAIAPPFAPPYQDYGSWYIRFNAPGCYGLQIDWSQGSERIIFLMIGENTAQRYTSRVS